MHLYHTNLTHSFHTVTLRQPNYRNASNSYCNPHQTTVPVQQEEMGDGLVGEGARLAPVRVQYLWHLLILFLKLINLQIAVSPILYRCVVIATAVWGLPRIENKAFTNSLNARLLQKQVVIAFAIRTRLQTENGKFMKFIRLSQLDGLRFHPYYATGF